MSQPEVILPDWPCPDNVRAAVTTRAGGVSHIEYAGFNLAAHVGDDPDAVAANRRILQSTLHLPEQPVWLSQVHGIDVLRRDSQSAIRRPLEYDACYSNQSGVVCAVLTADCLPVLFCSRDGLEVAAAHAGWRGLADGVLPATLAAFAAPPREVMAWLGPAIGPASFEVGDDVRQHFLHQWQACGEKAVEECFVPGTGGRWFCDLYALARLQLTTLGIRQVYGGGEDTCADWSRFYSFRRDGNTGRMASLIWRTA